MKTKIFTITSRIMFLTGLLLLTASALMVGASSPKGHNVPLEPETTQESTKSMQIDPCLMPDVYCETARVTKYGWTGNPMANGEYPYVGACATSDRTIPFGTVIEIIGYGECVVKDFTAKWVHEKHGLTIDLYSEETNQEMLNFGAKQMEIIIN